MRANDESLPTRMHGIAGFITSEQGPFRTRAEHRMVQAMLHESTYVSGDFRSEGLGLGLGWLGHPEPPSVPVPIWNARRDVCLIFVGDHFACLGQAANAEALLSLYEQRGVRFLEGLNGWFSGVLLDLRERRIILFNDRYGLGRVYYHQNADGFYFASEAKALLRVLPNLRQISPAGLGELITCGCTMQNRTLFPGISLLPGGSAWEFRPGAETRKQSYFDPTAWTSQPPLAPPVYYEALRETLTRVVPRYLTPPPQVALSLTGGVDSRMVLAAVTPSPGTLPCYTFGGMLRECADVRVAREIARVCQQPYRVLSLTKDFLVQFPALARESVYRTDGTMDVSGATALFVNGLAREVAPVRLTGNYGGEILRGLVPFRPRPSPDGLFSSELAPFFKQAADTYFAELQGHRTAFVAFKQVPWHHYGGFALEQSKLTVRTPFLDNELVRLAHQAPPAPNGDKGLARRFIAERSPVLGRVATDRGWPAKLNWLPRKLQRFCTEFMPRAEYAYDYGMPQWLARADHVMVPLRLQRLFLGRQKYAHFRIWYRDQLSAFVKEILLDPQTLGRPYLNGPVVRKMVSAHVNGHGNYTTEIHQLLSIEMIERHLIAQS